MSIRPVPVTVPRTVGQVPIYYNRRNTGRPADPGNPNKLFAAVGSNVLDMTFRLAGTTTPALVNGLGAVFTDVDTPGATTLEFFAADGRLLGHFAVPTRSDATGLSFVGVKMADTWRAP